MARANHLTKTQTSKEILNGYMADMDKLGEEYQAACADEHAEDYYVFFLDRQMDKLETLAYFYMDLVQLLSGSRK
jgi:hypothetical protein